MECYVQGFFFSFFQIREQFFFFCVSTDSILPSHGQLLNKNTQDLSQVCLINYSVARNLNLNLLCLQLLSKMLMFSCFCFSLASVRKHFSWTLDDTKLLLSRSVFFFVCENLHQYDQLLSEKGHSFSVFSQKTSTSENM